jgi:outer membrane lipoprotein SlyB
MGLNREKNRATAASGIAGAWRGEANASPGMGCHAGECIASVVTAEDMEFMIRSDYPIRTARGNRWFGWPWISGLGLLLALAGCGPSFSPDSYAAAAVQQANKVEQGVLVGVREVAVTASGTVGTVTGAAAGGIVGSQVGSGALSALGALGGTVLGGLAGSAAEKVTGEPKAYEYIVRKTGGDLVSVTQKDEKPLAIGLKVLVIAGLQARIVPDYTVPEVAVAPAVVPVTPPAAPAEPPPPPAERASESGSLSI